MMMLIVSLALISFVQIGEGASGMDVAWYHLNPKGAGAIPLNMDTGDAAGDLYFYLGQFLLPLECAAPDATKNFDCNNPERRNNEPLVVTKVQMRVAQNFTSYSPCNLCNGTDPFSGKACEDGTYVCDCWPHRDCNTEFVGFENVTAMFVPQPPSSECARKMQANCGYEKHKGDACWDCMKHYNYFADEGCGFTDTSDFCTSEPCNQTASDWVCWHSNVPRKTSGGWFSTLSDGYCDDDSTKRLGTNCSWTVRKTRTINETCLRDRVISTIESAGSEACFRACPDYPARNESSSCWIGCFFDSLLGPDARNSDSGILGGIPMEKLIDTWGSAFASESEGGCAPVKLWNSIDDDGFVAAASANDTACLVPGSGKIHLNPLCYQVETRADAEDLLRRDVLARGHVVRNGSCAENGFDKYLRMDPIFKNAALYSKSGASDTSMLRTKSLPTTTMYENYNQALNVIVPRGVSRGGTVEYLGDEASSTLTTCQRACRDFSKRCWSFVFIKSKRECYGVLSPGFNPSWDTDAVSGVMHWPCRDDEDCSLNGECIAETGTCACRGAWKGERCETLAIDVPPPKNAGYQGVDGGNHTSSWGGAVLKDRAGDDLYHLWASEMTEHCGIGAWAQNSRVIHATSKNPEGPYIRRDVVWEVFSHEPEVVPGNNGEYVMYFTADLRSPHGICDCCRSGFGPCDGSTGPGDCPSSSSSSLVGDSDGSFMSWSLGPNASSSSWSWSKPVPIFADYYGADTNFAPVILSNGSLVALWREWTELGSRQFVATASDWRNVSTYVRHEDRGELFPDLGSAGTEDQFVYLDAAGNFHAIFHHMYGTGTESQWWLDPTGGHAFSRDGFTWTYTGVAYGNATARYNTPNGQGARVRFADGSTRTFTRLERPHLIFASSSQLRGDPTHIINSAQYGRGTDPGTGAQNDDACYTLVRPIGEEGALRTKAHAL